MEIFSSLISFVGWGISVLFFVWFGFTLHAINRSLSIIAMNTAKPLPLQQMGETKPCGHCQANVPITASHCGYCSKKFLKTPLG